MSSVVGCPRGGGSPDNPSATEGETGKPGPSPAVADARWRPRITQVNSILRRCFAGICATAESAMAMWPAAVLLPAFPGRSSTARDSSVLSHQAVSG